MVSVLWVELEENMRPVVQCDSTSSSAWGCCHHTVDPKALCSHLSQSKLLAALNVSIKKCAEHREVISVHPFSWVALLVLQEEDWFWLWRDKDVSILNLQRSHLSIVSPAERNNRQWAENQTSLSRWKLRDVGRDSEAGTTRGSSQGTEMIRRLKGFSNKVMIEPGMSLISP